MSEEIKPFKVHIPDAELELLRKKLELARLPQNQTGTAWGEEAEGGVTEELMRTTIKHWQTAYDWRAEEARINQMPQFTTTIQIQGFDPVEVHFAHAKATSPRQGGAIPLLFLHGWPGSFIEVQPMLPLLLEAGFDVVAPSLIGYGFSGYPSQAGFTALNHAEAYHKVMLRLGYGSGYVVQGGDWGSLVGRVVTLMFPDSVKCLHLNMVISEKSFAPTPEGEQLSEVEKEAVGRAKWFREKQSAYQQVHATKTKTIGYALHDSPVGMLSWMVDKIYIWSDTEAKKWTPDELITWTLLHYFPGPTTGMVMYRENLAPAARQAAAALGKRVEQPVGVSHFPLEIVMAPRHWAEEELNITHWKVHDKGGHFAAYERPQELAADMIEFFHANWAK